jgi:tripartite-type tricarboxylate transporter receptor subunit TctC
MRSIRTCAFAAVMLAAGWSHAQALPDEIRIIVPVTAGSTLDSRARVLADALGKQLRRTVIVENRVGAGGTIGALAVSNSRPDGSMLLFTNNSQVISPHIYPNAGYDPIRDFAPVAQAYFTGMVLVAHPDLRVGTVKELATLARSQAQPISYASSGTGGLPHLGMEFLKQVAGMDLLHIPYRGDGQALADVLAGRVQVMMSGYIVAQPHIKAGKLRALAVTSKQRTAIFPDVPTIFESGYPAFAVDTWAGFFAPGGTPPDVVEKLNRAIAAAINTPAVQAQYAATGADPIYTTPAAFAAYVRREWESYGRLIPGLHLTPE